ncbi:hypothetical protein HMPREF1212_03180 [Parabacteroides sp. HGS0025]|uniref:hypothetical protein n=1 Tax=Parabacteroides sp. HGS0025 TaxID=1078087 RepID=UPI0006178FAF|nr:hypothetical protein [Parabacteroides sp. HGS0025]KKB50020.1 hypothetical protein HMPREF1212_03180 [Parabacteroides sp. HGS0025]
MRKVTQFLISAGSVIIMAIGVFPVIRQYAGSTRHKDKDNGRLRARRDTFDFGKEL